MKPKPSILITVIVALCLLGYIATRITNHDDHDNGHAENVVTSNNEHAHEEQEPALELTPAEIQEIGLKTAVAGNAVIDSYINLSGEIKVNQDKMAHIVPRVEGVVVEVSKKMGDTVKAGEVIAVIESQDLADTKAAYLASVERCALARLSFDREEKLWKEEISSEQDYLQKKQALTEARIDMKSNEQKLRAIGFDESYLNKLAEESGQFLTRFEMKAPFDGTIIEKHIVLGELVGTESAVYVIADLSTVWVDLQVYPKDLKHIEEGQKAAISIDPEMPDSSGTISYVGPVLGTESRTALARVVLENEKGIFRPGLFVTAKVSVSQRQADVAVLKEAIQLLEGKKCVFVKDEHDFEPVFVQTGHVNTKHVEILSGLTAGQEYVTAGAFALKSKIVTSTLDSHAGHGH